MSTSSVSSNLLATMNNTSTSSSTSSTSSTTDTDAVQNRFLKLLIAQMTNQDPLNPLDNSEVTSQMAQLSTVTGISQLNTTLSTLLSDIQSSQAMNATDMIGHGVFVPGSSVTLSSTTTDGKTTSQGVLGVELASAADTVTVKIRDSSGNLVKTLDLGSQDAGVIPIAWDGSTTSGTTAADGQYKFEVTASKGGTAVTSTALAYGSVLSVTTSSTGAKLTVGNVGTVSVSDVREIL